MVRIRDDLLKGGLVINLTASGDSMNNALKAAEKFCSFGGARKANPECQKKEPFFSLLQNKKESAEGFTSQEARAVPEVYASPSLQIGFAAVSLPAAPYGSLEQAAELAFSLDLSTGAIRESIRMMGGAYGAYAYPNNLEGVFSFATYRDPDPLRSLGAFPAILKKRGGSKIDEDSLEKVIIGAYAKETRPRTPAENGFFEFVRRLYGITDDHRLTRLKHIAALSAEDTGVTACRLAEAANSLAAEKTHGAPVIIAGIKTAEKAAKKLGVELKELPV
jgi:Zn-dependent M16 (insulinase) family peptidase